MSGGTLLLWKGGKKTKQGKAKKNKTLCPPVRKILSGRSARPLTALCMQHSWAAPFQGCDLERFLRPFPLLGSRVVLFTVPMSLLASFHSCQGYSHVSTVGSQRAEKCVKRNITAGKTCFLKLSPYCRWWVTTLGSCLRAAFWLQDLSVFRHLLLQ